MDHKKSRYELILEPLTRDNFCPLYRGKLRYQLENNAWCKWHYREYVDRPDAVAVLPIDFKDEKIILLKQFRIGAIREDPWLWEIVAGLKENGESDEIVARRELQEETGLKALKLKFLHRYFVSPGYSNERVSLFIASVDSKELKSLGGQAIENEFIYPYAVPIEETLKKLNSGIINNSLTIIALQYLQYNWKKITDTLQ